MWIDGLGVKFVGWCYRYKVNRGRVMVVVLDYFFDWLMVGVRIDLFVFVKLFFVKSRIVFVLGYFLVRLKLIVGL